MAEATLLSTANCLPYPERSAEPDSPGSNGRFFSRRRLRLEKFVAAVAAEATAAAAACDSDPDTCIRSLRIALVADGLNAALAAQAFALVRELAERKLGQRHYDAQVAGGWILMNGMLAEMETGEGKTLTATLPACTAALARIPVHVLTVNDYLAQRDAEEMGPLYRALGLSVGIVTATSTPAQRHAAYGCDVTYCTGQQAAFDYLRDRLTLGRNRSPLRLRMERLYADNPRLDRLLMRGLHYAIVDEADSVLIDEARTPLILSRSREDTAPDLDCEKALAITADLVLAVDFRLDMEHKIVELSARGTDICCAAAESAGWQPRGGQRRVLELSRCALLARHAFEEGRDYLVRDEAIQIIDANTGRILPDRAWGRDLQALLEIKEACAASAARETLARISYQNFFSRYLNLSGMTGTAAEVAGELHSTYGLRTRRIPVRLKPRRVYEGLHLFARNSTRTAALVTRVHQRHDAGRPVLVGTRSVSGSRALSEALEAAGLAHRVLDASQDACEASVVAAAGRAGAITVATNMAGRGTDIRLDDDALAAGGLHVISTDLNDARRVDRQLFGRSARQGDPGSCEMYLSLEDELLRRLWPAGIRHILGRSAMDGTLPRWLAGFIRFVTCVTIERRHRSLRARVREADREYDRLLAFSGDPE